MELEATESASGRLIRSRYAAVLGVGLRTFSACASAATSLVRELVLEDAAPFVPLAINKRGKQTDYEAKTVMLAGRRCIVCRNHQEAEKDAADRASIVAALERQLAKGDKALVGNTGYRRYLKTISDQTSRLIPTRSRRTTSSTASSYCAPIPTSTRSRPCSATGSSTRPSAATCSAASSV